MAATDMDLNNLSNDPEELMRAFEQIEAGDVPTPVAEAAAGPVVNGEDGTTNVETADKNPQQKAEPVLPDPDQDQGVATKDGKHIIPYTVLKGERERGNRAEQLAADLRAQVASLEAQVKAGNQGAKDGEGARTTPVDPAASELSNEDLEALKEDFPTVYKAVMASMAAAKTLEAQLKPVQESVRSQEAESARTASESVQDAIDSTPKLAHIQATDPAAFELAKQFDATLRGQSAWANKTLSERFLKVTEMVEATLGQIDLPGAKPASQKTPEELKTAALAMAASSAKATRTNVPTSLSEFPAGRAPAQDEHEAAENMSPLQLAEKFSSMTPDQMDAYFQTM